MYAYVIVIDPIIGADRQTVFFLIGCVMESHEDEHTDNVTAPPSSRTLRKRKRMEDDNDEFLTLSTTTLQPPRQQQQQGDTTLLLTKRRRTSPSAIPPAVMTPMITALQSECETLRTQNTMLLQRMAVMRTVCTVN